MGKSKKTADIAFYAVFAALICVLSPISIPVTTPPVTLSVFAVTCVSAVMGGSAVISVAVYLLIGALGLPIFSSFTGGIGALLGPTGGFLIGYIPFALLVGKANEKDRKILHAFLYSLVGLVLLYALGGCYYGFSTRAGLLKSFAVSVIPFVIPDMLKIYLGILCGRKIKKIIKRV